MSDARPSLVLDKSFLQGVDAATMHRLALSSRLLMTDSLFYEVLTNDRDRGKCFAKFPAIENPATLVSHVGWYLAKELSLRRPAPLPSLSALSRERFKFSPDFLDPDFVPNADASLAQDEKLAEVRQDMAFLVARALEMPKRFPQAFAGNQSEREEGREAVETAMVADRDLILAIYAGVRAPKGKRGPPPARDLSGQWFIYKWIQVRLLFALDLALRYGDALQGTLSAGIQERIEHDALDAEYLMVGAHEGGFATEEKKLRRWFGMMRPDGRLVARRDLIAGATARAAE